MLRVRMIFETFDVMRKSQFLIWDLPLLESYWQDLQEGKAQGRNLVMEKYAYMMESTAPKEYEAIATGLPKISEEKQAMVEQIVAIQVGWREEFAEKYPHLSGQARIIHTSEDTLYDISFVDLSAGKNLRHILCRHWCSMEDVLWRLCRNKKIMTEEIMRYTTAFYGYKTLEDAE